MFVVTVPKGSSGRERERERESVGAERKKGVVAGGRRKVWSRLVPSVGLFLDV